MFIKTSDGKIGKVLTEENIKEMDKEAAEELLKKAQEKADNNKKN